MVVPVRVDKRVAGVAALWAGAVVTALLVVLHRSGGDIGLLDLRVYRTGGEAWLEDVRLYSDGFPKPLDGPPFPFTYPPLAAFLFSPLALVPWSAAVLIWTGVGLALLTGVCLVTAEHAYGRTQRALLVGLGVALGSLLLEPVTATLDFGQINLVLLGLAALDCLLPKTPWPRGLLIGLAAAVKLTPMVFVLFFLPRGQIKPVVTAVASFVGFGLVGFAVAPTDSKQYWFGALLDPGRVGGLDYVANQSLRGLVNRWGLTGTAETAVWGLLCLAAVALVWVAVARSGQDRVGAFLAVAVGGLLVSPVSWTHHWVWVVPGIVYLLHRSWPWAAAVALLFWLAPQWYMPYEDKLEQTWTWWQQVIGNAYVWAALAALVVLALRPRPAAVTTP
ncbi:glycosyltransferase 87 family protein [Saccharothrix longispora]|uniref:glycosyltransferase 87 family protein n=1 Tax=Saccharothrix longispora TaxID=33920 RepID=UPI0028FD1DC3|nr:glycosyltransferase 87 family protein [Saccharothrix longispora]MDU0294653.1 glycosyltransferase 87 family protein [Saccharothrix longispora]